MVSNKALSIALARIAGLTILSTAAFAGGDFASAPAVAPAATVEGPSGFYATGRVGRGNNNWNQILEEGVPSAKHKGFAGGVNVGYAFNQFLAIEAGYTYLPKTTWDVYRIEFANQFASMDSYRVGQIKNAAFDLSGKITVPVPGTQNIGLFAKAGVAKLRSSIKASEQETLKTPFFTIREDSYVAQRLSNTTLTYGFGVYWDITSSLRLDAGYQTWRGRHENVNNDKISQPNMDAYTMGLTYFIGGSDSLFNS